MLNIPLPPLTELDYTMPQVWDSTMIVAARKCPKLFLYAYANHIRGGGVAPPLHFGGAFAKGLEAYRQEFWSQGGGRPALALEAGSQSIFEYWGDQPSVLLHRGKPDKRTLAKCLLALLKYFERWPMDTDLLQPYIDEHGKVTFEYSFSLPLEDPIFPRMKDGSPFFLCGRMDTLGSYAHLPVWSDEKTTIAMGDSWAEQWPTRHQFMGYGYALRELGFKARHVIVRGIAIYNDDIVFAETQPIHRPDHLLDKFAFELAWTLRQIQAYFDVQQVPRSFGDACYSYFRQCDFWTPCSTSPSKELPFLRAMPRHQWNPLHLITAGEE